MKPPSHRKINEIYKDLPKLACQGKCQKSCGPVMMSRIEWGRIGSLLGYKPEGTASLVCPMLNQESGRCNVYDIRPMICRIWGLVRKMACPFGCVPDRWLSDEEASHYLNEMNRISGEPVRRSIKIGNRKDSE